MEGALYVLYIGRYHLDDALFLQSLARMLAVAGPARPPCVLVHGSGERAERVLEGEAYDVKRNGRVLAAGSVVERRIVERAVRESNQKIIGILTDAVVHGVGLQGADRGLVRVREDGRVEIGKVGWIQDLARKQAVPVISALSRNDDTGEVIEVDAAEVAARFAAACGPEAATVVFFTRGGKARIPGQEGALGETPLSALKELDLVPDLEAVACALEAGAKVLVGGVPGLLTAQGVAGMQIVA